jgi:hypothetical protein
VGVAEGVGAAELLGIGTAAVFTLFHINFLPVFVHVYLTPDDVML